MSLPKFSWKSGYLWGTLLIANGVFFVVYIRATLPIAEMSELEYRLDPVEGLERHERGQSYRFPCFCGVVIKFVGSDGNRYYFPEESAGGDLEGVYRTLKGAESTVGVRFDPVPTSKDGNEADLEHVVYEISVDGQSLRTYEQSARSWRKSRDAESWAGLWQIVVGVVLVLAQRSSRRAASKAPPAAKDPGLPAGR